MTLKSAHTHQVIRCRSSRDTFCQCKVLEYWAENWALGEKTTSTTPFSHLAKSISNLRGVLFVKSLKNRVIRFKFSWKSVKKPYPRWPTVKTMCTRQNWPNKPSDMTVSCHPTFFSHLHWFFFLNTDGDRTLGRKNAKKPAQKCQVLVKTTKICCIVVLPIVFAYFWPEIYYKTWPRWIFHRNQVRVIEPKSKKKKKIIVITVAIAVVVIAIEIYQYEAAKT